MYRQNRLVALATFAFFAVLAYTGREFDEVAAYMPVAALWVWCSVCVCLLQCV